MSDLSRDIAMEVAAAVVAQFNQLKPGQKPQTRSNGDQEWTVLAGVCLVDDQNHTECITFATGVKVVPERARDYSHGTIIMDNHAEMLALRAFNWWILKHIDDDKYFEASDIAGKRRLKLKYSVQLYISEPPCGDALMSYIAQDQPAWKRRKVSDIDDNSEDATGGVARGRAQFDELGVVRTKPGRADSLLSLSKLCSDKFALKQVLGVTNSMVSSVVEPIWLEAMVVPESKYVEQDFDRCFNRVDGHQIKVKTTDSEFSYGKHPDKVAAANSVVGVVGGPIETLVHGVKLGSYKKNQAPNPKGQSKFCNWQMWQTYGERILRDNSTKAQNYCEFKENQIERQRRKAHVQKQLGRWVRTGSDDFPLMGTKLATMK